MTDEQLKERIELTLRLNKEAIEQAERRRPRNLELAAARSVRVMNEAMAELRRAAGLSPRPN